MSTDKGTIKIPREDFDRHNERRQANGQTWREYIDGQAPESNMDAAAIAAELSERLDVGPGELESDVDLGDIRAELRQLEELIEQSPERVAEELRG